MIVSLGEVWPQIAAAAAVPRPAAPAPYPGDLVPMSNMRKLIAKHMIESRRTSAHVHCMYEVDLTRIVNLRNKLKTAFEQRHGVRLTLMPFFVRAALIALQQWPIINANIDGDNIRYHRNINLGIAVALDWGLIVPVLKNAGDLNFLGLQRGITDLGERAPRLRVDDLRAGLEHRGGGGGRDVRDRRADVDALRPRREGRSRRLARPDHDPPGGWCRPGRGGG